MYVLTDQCHTEVLGIVTCSVSPDQDVLLKSLPFLSTTLHRYVFIVLSKLQGKQCCIIAMCLRTQTLEYPLTSLT
jgi:hypothetical protein